MHPDNHRFGQSQILAVYADPDHRHIDPWSPPSIRGRMQAEWDLTTRRRPAIEQLTDLIWSTPARRRRMAAGEQPGFVLGAAWAYALRVPRDAFRTWQELAARKEDPPPPVAAQGTLYLPSHGIQGTHHARRLAGHLLRAQGPATVALPAADACVAEIRAAYTDLGHAAVGLGVVEDEPGTDEPRYLVRLLDLFARHERVAANAPRVELLYAAAAGLRVGIDGPVLGEQDPMLTHLARRLSGLDDAGWRSYADLELGTLHVAPPDELRTLLDWTHDD